MRGIGVLCMHVGGGGGGGGGGRVFVSVPPHAITCTGLWIFFFFHPVTIGVGDKPVG